MSERPKQRRSESEPSGERDGPSDDLRIEYRFKNGALFTAVWERFQQTAELLKKYRGPAPILRTASQSMGVSCNILQGLLNLRISPYYTSAKGRDGPLGLPKPQVRQIADYLEQSVEALFPRHLYAAKFPRLLALHVPSLQLLPLSEAGDLADPVDFAEQLRLKDTLGAVMRCLPLRQREVLTLHFGLGGGEPQSLKDLSERLGVCQARVYQIEQQAIRKLRERGDTRLLEWRP